MFLEKVKAKELFCEEAVDVLDRYVLTSDAGVSSAVDGGHSIETPLCTGIRSIW
jgi:hypothetical protein